MKLINRLRQLEAQSPGKETADAGAGGPIGELIETCDIQELRRIGNLVDAGQELTNDDLALLATVPNLPKEVALEVAQTVAFLYDEYVESGNWMEVYNRRC